LVFLLAGAFSASADLNDGLVGYWSFDEGSGGTAYDYSGFGNHGTIENALWVNGVSGAALEFDPDSGLITVPDTASLNIHGNTEITLVTWIHKNGPDKHGSGEIKYSYPIIKSGPWSYDPNTVSRYALQERNTDELRLIISEVDSPLNILNYNFQPGLIGRWLHVVGTWDGSTMILYVNGEPVATKTNSGNLGDTTERPLKISGGYPFNGIMDEVRVYNRALGPDEILDLYWGDTHPDPQEDTTDGDKSNVSGTSNDPVNTATGSFFHQQTDLSITGRGSPLIFKRYYNSKAAAPSRSQQTLKEPNPAEADNNVSESTDEQLHSMEGENKKEEDR
jgi:hypothetical protein